MPFFILVKSIEMLRRRRLYQKQEYHHDVR